MVDAEERLTALKKAYADIILNTAKEAAARIMESERRALRLQHELNASKEQSLQIVLRLKKMMDSKVSEAEMAYLSQHRRIRELEGQLRNAANTIYEAEATSLTQQKKAEVLEAQLQEAEDIVHDLRTELREVQAELERVSSEKSKHINKCGTGTQVQASEDISHSSQSLMYPPPIISSLTKPDINNSALQQINEVYKCNEENEDFPESCYARKSDILSASEEHRPNASQPSFVSPQEPLNVSSVRYSALSQKNQIHQFNDANALVQRPKIPSVVLRTKEAEPYRNRRTQRIRAFEEKLMAGELSFADTAATTYEATGTEDGEGEGIHRTPVQKPDNTCNTDEQEEEEADNPNAKFSKANPVHVKQRKRKNRLRDLYKVLERDQTSSIAFSEGNFTNRNDSRGRDPCKTLGKVSVDKEVQKENFRAVKSWNILDTDKVLMGKQLLVTPENGSAQTSDVVHNKRAIESSQSKTKNIKPVRRGWRKRKIGSMILLDQAVERDWTPDTTFTETNSEKNSAQRVGEDSKTVPIESILLRCTKGTVNDAVVVQGSSALNITNSVQASVNKLIPIMSDSGSIESSVVPTNQTEADIPADHPILNSEMKASDAGDKAPRRPITERVFKYTFQRKRKRDTLSRSNSNISLETSILKENKVEEQNVTVEMKNPPTSATEPYRHSRRETQVARQLISLSETKW